MFTIARTAAAAQAQTDRTPTAHTSARGHRALKHVGQEDPPAEGIHPHAEELIHDLRRNGSQRERVVEEHAPSLRISHRRQIEQREAPRIDDVVVPGDEVGDVVVLGPDPFAARAGDELRIERQKADDDADRRADEHAHEALAIY